MFSQSGYDANAKRRKSVEARRAFDDLVAFAGVDPEKKLVLNHIAQIVAAGYAEFTVETRGEIEVRFTSGDIYLLGQASILRLA